MDADSASIIASDREILVVVNKDEDNSEEVTIPEGVVTLQDLQTLIEQTFTELKTGSIRHLQIFSEKFKTYKNLKSLEKIEDGNRINAVLKKQQVEPAPATPRDSPVEPPENGCKTCFTFDDEQEIGSATATPQDQIGEEAGAIFPHSRLWNKRTLLVWFLNSIPPSWTYRGHNYPVPNGRPGHVLHTSDIIRLANNWSTKLPTSIPPKQRECVPTFVEADSAINSDIRVLFQTKGGSSTNIGTAATKVPNATMLINLGGDDRYKEHLVMHEFGHALGLGHEHQRKVFGNVILKFFDNNVLKKEFRQYSRDIAAYPDDDDHKIYSEYDPDSIMHYWFDPSWLKHEYSTEHKVHHHTGISDDERKVLKALYRRKKLDLAEEISEIDHRFVAETYYDHFTKPEAPPNETDASGGAPDHSELPPDPTDNIIINSSDDKGKPLYFNTLYETACKKGQRKWLDIGNALNLDADDLSAIAEKHRNDDPGHCFRSMLIKWFESNEECYFKDFIVALKSKNVEFATLAQHVKDAISARAEEIEREKKAIVTKRKYSSGHEHQGSKKPRRH